MERMKEREKSLMIPSVLAATYLDPEYQLNSLTWRNIQKKIVHMGVRRGEGKTSIFPPGNWD